MKVKRTRAIFMGKNKNFLANPIYSMVHDTGCGRILSKIKEMKNMFMVRSEAFYYTQNDQE